MASRRKSGSENDDEKEIRVVKEGECSKFFHVDLWLRKGLDVQRPPDVDTVKITEDQKQVIHDTWSLVNDQLAETGTLMHMRIFQVSSAIRAVFHMDDVPSEEMAAQPNLKIHSVKFMQAIETAVENLDSLDDTVAPIFINLGRRHIYFKDLKEEYFNVFGGALTYTWQMCMGRAYTNEIRSAWSRLFDYLVQHMRCGFMTALAEKQAEKDAADAAKRAAEEAEAAAKMAAEEAEAEAAEAAAKEAAEAAEAAENDNANKNGADV
ncbi:hypothetical protein LSAT2_027184 [Lamellibrachia satsuma]|nr:hypothetical protein LSAT2_027184 [Lamellibrachia satsuma]